ncbi:hypothetical protein V8D89_001994 [Ganoderma adspersum]
MSSADESPVPALKERKIQRAFLTFPTISAQDALSSAHMLWDKYLCPDMDIAKEVDDHQRAHPWSNTYVWTGPHWRFSRRNPSYSLSTDRGTTDIRLRPPPKGDGQPLWLKAFVEDEFPLIEPSSFPRRDPMDELIYLYFAQMNAYCPPLHEPTFRKAIATREHLRNGGLGATVLFVCAIALRFTRDPRVLLNCSDHHHSAGWKWFLLMNRLRKTWFAPAKICDLQICVVLDVVHWANAPQSTWPIISAGIRIALNVGAHRKKMYSPNPTVRRSSGGARSGAKAFTSCEDLGAARVGDELRFDIAPPTEYDNKYWLTPEGEPSFKQPPGKPSKVAAFVCVLKLGQILAFAMRTVFDEQWEQRIVADLDSALNKWSDSLPSHLRWDPEQQNMLWLTQAASLRAFHYYAQFAVHRPFMAASRHESPLSCPSVIICTNGARSSIQVLEVLYKRTGSPCHRNMGMLFMSGIFLMMNILSLKRTGRVLNSGKDLDLVEKAIEMLRSLRYDGALPTGSEGLGLGLPSTQGFAAPTNGTSIIMQREPLEQVPVPPLSIHPTAYGFLPRQYFDPTQPELPRNNPEHHQFDVAGGQMFGLQPLGYIQLQRKQGTV